MAINDNIIVMAGKTTPTAVDVETKSTIKHATTRKVNASEKEAEYDINDPAIRTKNEDKNRAIAISVNKLPDILGGST